eukprot:m.132580 g.132580  ORF g.132580 m.132580 type:complete len:198 (+) comp13935_c0_seq1:412-1005(+)
MSQQTLALIKPDAIHQSDAILDQIEKRGFTILEKRRVRLTMEQASEFYAEHYGKSFYANLIGFMCSGPIMALILSKPEAILAWRETLGPTNSNVAREQAPQSLRALFGTDQTRNALHGSDSSISAMREIRFFFPSYVVDAPEEAESTRDYLESNVNPTLVRGLTALCKAKPEEPLRWLADWLEQNNPNRPDVVEPDE